jgi:tetratricopeptide (TPR) repeat protein
MKKALILFAFLLFAISAVSAQDLRKKAEENPLNLAFYLLTKDRSNIDAEKLADAFLEVGRYDDALRAIDLESEYSRELWLVSRLSLLVKQGKKAKANLLLDKIFQIARQNNQSLNDVSPEYLAPSFIKLNRMEEALSLYDFSEADEVGMWVKMARACYEANQTENALKILPKTFEFANAEQKAEIIELYARLKQTEKAEKMLAEFEPTAFVEAKIDAADERVIYQPRDVLFPLINTYLALGKVEQALIVWQQYGENDNDYYFIRLIDALIEFGYRDKANIYLAQIHSNDDMLATAGADIVERHLKLDNVEFALKLAKTMSDENDDYRQQKALMSVADRLIADGKNEIALEILDFAFNKARKIVFEHDPMASIGASSGSRKAIYLRNIYERMMRLKQFDRAYATINAIGSDHWIAIQFIAESSFDFIERQIKTLPRPKIYEILAKMETLFTEDDREYFSIEIKLLSAKIHLQTGGRAKAFELLVKVLEEAKESCCYEDDFLLSVGILFERNKLQANPNIKKVLRKFIVDG